MEKAARMLVSVLMTMRAFSSNGRAERRGTVRVPAQLSARLSRIGTRAVISTITRDVSCNSCYCSTAEDFAAGEIIGFTLFVPLEGAGTNEPIMTMECFATVARVDRGKGIAVQWYSWSVKIQFLDGAGSCASHDTTVLHDMDIMSSSVFG